jgi:trans-aconitate 2-methyltransferase
VQQPRLLNLAWLAADVTWAVYAIAYECMPTRDWDAAAYDRLSDAQFAMGREVMARLDLRGDESVLDAGCGSGRLTAELVRCLPDGRVLAVDGSPSMAAAARERLGGSAEVFVGDLVSLELDEPVEAIFSNATFHWIADHDALFARLRAALVPGGRLAAQFGADGNIAEVQEAIDRVIVDDPHAAPLKGWTGPWNFATPAQAARRLHDAGFVDVWTWRTWVRVEPDEPEDYFATVVLGAHLDRLAPERRAAFTAAVLERLERPVAVRYARLNVLARRPA